MRQLTIILAATTVLVVALSPVSVAADPFTGKWQLDPSKTEDSNPLQVTLTSITNGVSLRANQQMPFVAYYNGKDYPIGTSDTINALRMNDRTLVSTTKRNGKILSKATTTVTTDGKHAITIMEGWGAEGPYTNTIVGNRVSSAPSGDAFLGTWQEDPSQAKYDPPLTYTLKVSENKLDFTTNRAQAIRAKLDGKDHEQNTVKADRRLHD
jgi:hypothetical protein